MVQRVIAFQDKALKSFFIVITLYIALLNSFALFAVYPALKQHNAGLPIIVYLFLASPVLGYGLFIARRSNTSKMSRQTLAGISGILLIFIFSLAKSHNDTGLIVTSTVTYLLTGFVEESLWRGLLWRAVRLKTQSNRLTLALVSAHFVVLHIPFALLRMANPVLFLGKVLALGLALGGVRIVSKSYRLPVFVHVAVNMIAKT